MKRLLLITALLFGFSDLHSQNCIDSVYSLGFFSPDSIYASNHIVTEDNGSLIIGETRSYPSKKGLLIRLNSTGDIVWSKQMQGSSQLDLDKTIQLTDGGFIVAGSVLHPTSKNIFLAKIDAGGNLLWQKLFPLNNNGNQNPVHIYNITEGLNGDILVSWIRGSINFHVNDDKGSSILMRLDAQGVLVWSKYLTVADYGYSNLAGIFLINDRITVIGQAYDNTSTCPISGSGGLFTLMELDYNTGMIQQQKSYCFLEIPSNVSQGESADNHFSAIKMENGNLALFGTFYQRTDSSYHYKILFDSNLNPYRTRLFATPYTFHNAAIIRVLPSGETAITRLNNTTRQAFYGFLDSNGNIISQKLKEFSTDIIPIDFIYNFSFHSFDWTVREREENKISIVNNHTIAGRRYIEFTKMHKGGDTIPCLGSEASFISSLPFNITPTAWSWNDVADNRIIASPANFTITDYSIQKEVKCLQVTEPFINLGNDVTICKGDSIILNANAGFLNYSWSPADFTQLADHMIIVSPDQPVNYTVSAFTTDGCEVSDTIRVDPLPPIPSFIYRDTAICPFEVLTLRPVGNFNSYLWNDGSTSAFLNIDKPGNYWLEVTNQDGCKAKQEITVRPKTCSSFIYFPSAFTPNKDGKNDLFKPITSGPLLVYHFEIYNRWGQKMFSSRDPQKGWDGSMNSAMQESGVFVWVCEYQLAGQKKEYKKGTAVLIK